MMTLDRVEILKRLLSVSPGLAQGKDPIQGDCIIIKNGRFYTFNSEVACSIVSGIDEDIQAAIKASALLALMKKFTEKEIKVTISERKFSVTTPNRDLSLKLEADVLLPIDAVEIPKVWTRLEDGWTEAVELVHRCATKKHKDFDRICVHVTPDWIEASENNKAARWTLKTFVTEPCLVRAQTLKTIVPLGMTKGCETKNWLHFKNPMGLRVSLRKWVLDSPYVDLTQFFDVRGERVVFPKGIAEAAEAAGLLLDDRDGCVLVDLSEDHLIVESEGSQGKYREKRPVVYEGKPVKFLVPPKLIGELVENNTECEVSKVSLRIEKENYVYMTSLEVKE